MKKIIFGMLTLIVIIAAGGYTWYQMSYGGVSYYMQVTQDGKKTEIRDDAGKAFENYIYHEKAYESSGKEKSIEFTADHNLRHKAYIKLTYNNAKGVTNWEEVEKTKIPEKALEKLNQ